MKVLGFLWIAMSTTYQVAMMTYPANYLDFPKLIKGVVGTLIT